MKDFTLSLTATPESIDELGHVNNAVWVQWIQQVATGHWDAAAPQAHKDAYIWVVVRHEIDYLRALGPGETAIARTWVADKPHGAKFDRFMEFTGADGRVHVRARTVWALLDKASGRPLRVSDEIVAPFLDSDPAGGSMDKAPSLR
ncbi:acyl-CoA thioesterase [Sphingopyxis indica]|uniref:Acyl-CoA thioester hydrolase n=1 Tax=Sphingopyxis indica TaxID=436663 RepID=A0A239J2N4_9SPHN|nr:acyl-CoA thioesterase [Sphingopyxis indica]SNS99523.1 acyl-CoA thioester hydrolase [Sphingopyxis indica]